MFPINRLNLSITRDGDNLVFKARKGIAPPLELVVDPDSLKVLLDAVKPKTESVTTTVTLDGKELRRIVDERLDRDFGRIAEDYQGKAG